MGPEIAFFTRSLAQLRAAFRGSEVDFVDDSVGVARGGRYQAKVF